MLCVKFKKKYEVSIVPTKGTPDAAGWDLYACLVEGKYVDYEQLLKPGERCLVPTGLLLEIPSGFEGQIRPRSGLAKQGIIPAFGTIDSDYRGEVMVNLFNNSFKGVWIQQNQRIAQLVIQPVLQVSFEEAETLSDTLRGAQGFGSTGV